MQNNPFEGPEKLLEIWFSTLESIEMHSTSHNLRSIERHVWQDMLRVSVKCSVLSVISNDYMDAYLLSESSMFIYPHKMIIKTCGTTTLLAALPHVFTIAHKYCGYQRPFICFYSRKAFLFPELQSEPHRSWKEETAFIDMVFEKRGHVFTVGDANSNAWYLYVVMTGGPRDTPNAAAASITNKNPCDETLEILMSNLDPGVAKDFYCDNNVTGSEGGMQVSKRTGILKLYPNAMMDSFQFYPCGYSANGLVEDGYFTIHVTPEPGWSFASFETNIPASRSHADHHHCLQQTTVNKTTSTISPTLIRHVIDIFQPGSFLVTLLSSSSNDLANKLEMLADIYQGYESLIHVYHSFDHYNLVFVQYERVIIDSNHSE